MVAHAFGTLEALPGASAVWLVGAVSVYAGTAAYLTRRDAVSQSPPLRRSRTGSTQTVDRPARGRPAVDLLRRALGGLGLAGLLLLAVTGPTAPDRSPLPRTLLVVILGGVVPLSLLLGPFYRGLNPLRGLAGALARLADAAPRPLPPRVGRWPAAVLALVALTAAQRALDAPVAVAVGLLVYVGGHVALGARYGPTWFSAGDVTEALSDVVGAAAPVGTRPGRGIGRRDPVAEGARAEVLPGTLALVGVVVGSTWIESIDDVVTFPGDTTAVVAAAVSCVVATGLLRLGAIRDFLVPAVMPLAGAYGMQLFTVPLLLDGQIALAQLSDPLGRGATPPAGVAAGARLPVPDVAVGAILLVVFVALHLVALATAHRAALLRFDLRGARAVQFPVRVVLLTSLLVGLWLPTLGG